jgi:hypothetical protein
VLLLAVHRGPRKSPCGSAPFEGCRPGSADSSNAVRGLASRSSSAVGWALSLQRTSRFDLNYQEVFASYPALLNYIAARIDHSGGAVGPELAEFTDNVGAYNSDPVLDSSHLIHSPGLSNQVRIGTPRRQSVVCRDAGNSRHLPLVSSR